MSMASGHRIVLGSYLIVRDRYLIDRDRDRIDRDTIVSDTYPRVLIHALSFVSSVTLDALQRIPLSGASFWITCHTAPEYRTFLDITRSRKILGYSGELEPSLTTCAHSIA